MHQRAAARRPSRAARTPPSRRSQSSRDRGQRRADLGRAAAAPASQLALRRLELVEQGGVAAPVSAGSRWPISAASRPSLAMRCARMRWRPHRLTMCSARRARGLLQGLRELLGGLQQGVGERVDAAQGRRASSRAGASAGASASQQRVASVQRRAAPACRRIGERASRGCRARAGSTASRSVGGGAACRCLSRRCATTRTRRCDSMRSWPARFIASAHCAASTHRARHLAQAQVHVHRGAAQQAEGLVLAEAARAHQHALGAIDPACARRAARARARARGAGRASLPMAGLRRSRRRDATSAAAACGVGAWRQRLPVMQPQLGGARGQRRIDVDRRRHQQHGAGRRRRPRRTAAAASSAVSVGARQTSSSGGAMLVRCTKLWPSHARTRWLGQRVQPGAPRAVGGAGRDRATGWTSAGSRGRTTAKRRGWR